MSRGFESHTLRQNKRGAPFGAPRLFCLAGCVEKPCALARRGEFCGFFDKERVQNKFPRHAKIMLDILKELKHWNNDKYKDQVKIEIVIGEARYEIG